MKFVRLLSVVLTAALASAASAQTSAPTDVSKLTESLNQRYRGGVVAVVEGKVIMVSDLVREMTPHLPGLRQSAGGDEDFLQRTTQLSESVTRNLIERATLVAEFRADPARKIPDTYVDNAVADELAQRFEGDRSKFLAFLRAQGKTQREFRREKEEEIIYSYMRNQRRAAAGGASAQPASALQPTFAATAAVDDAEPAVHLRMIQLSRAEGETDAGLQVRADQVLARFKAGEKFDALAREFTAGAGKAKGGDWGWLKRDAFKKEFADIAFGLQRGEISAAILLPEGAFILFVEDRK